MKRETERNKRTINQTKQKTEKIGASYSLSYFDKNPEIIHT